jgi:cell division septation protein DedD
MRHLALLSILLLFSATSDVCAQSMVSITSPNDSVFRRARRLVSEGNGVTGRALVDSLLAREQEGSTGYGNALYWRGALAETAADAERDYRRVIVEYPLSAYADDALLAIAELEQARGDPAGALQHLQRFVKEHPVSPARGTAAFAAARLAFEQRDTRTGCALIADARISVASTDVELRNQIDYFGSRCTGADGGANVSEAGAPIPSTPAKPARDSTSRTSVAPKKAVAVVVPKTTPQDKPAPASSALERATRPATKARGIYTIQLAAYSIRADAERLVTKLGASGVKARISGVTKPFRVRLDFYPTRQAALDEVASLKQRGIIGFVVIEESAPEGKAP